MFGNTEFVKRFKELAYSDIDAWTFPHDNTMSNNKAEISIYFKILSGNSFEYWTFKRNNYSINLGFWEKVRITNICHRMEKLKIIREIEKSSDSPLIKENLILKEKISKLENKSKLAFLTKETNERNTANN